ncbi:AraC family transcriptional regulator [Ruminococcus flavefaciens]|nr:AraC family transcriptional regulator [Ruminococcus flavefaciens]
MAFALGFSSQSAFISVFRKINGITPKKYRELHYMDVIEGNRAK